MQAPQPTKNALVVATDPEVSEELALTMKAFGWTTTAVDNFDLAAEIAATDETIDLAILAPQNPVSKSFSFVRTVGASGRRGLPTILVCDRGATEITEAFFEGVDAVLLRPYTIEYISKGIESAYASRMGFSARENARMRLYRAKVKYTFDSTHAKGYGTNLSIGGIFIGSDDPLPTIGKIVQFKIESETDQLSLNGFAKVRWLRTKLEFGKPRGFGINFESLSRGSEETLKAFLAKGKTS